MGEILISDSKEIETFYELLSALEGYKVRLWTQTTAACIGPEGGSIALVGVLTLGNDFVIIGDYRTSYWTAVPLKDVGVVELVEVEGEEADIPEVDRQLRFEEYYQGLVQKRKPREP